MFDATKETLISEKVITKTNYERLKKTLFYTKNFIDSDGSMHLTVDSLIKINNIIRKITTAKFYSILVNEIHQF